MANLYEINEQILNCVDMETGEIIDADKLQDLQLAFDEKVEGIACWIKNLLSDASAIKAEKDALAEREKACKNKAESLKNYLSSVLYDKWVDLAACVWDLVCECYTYRDDLTIIFTAHTQTDHDENGYMFTRIKTSGKKLDKIVLESKFTTVLLSKCVDGQYKFETQANNSTAKSPLGAFKEFEIDNDIVEVIKALEDF